MEIKELKIEGFKSIGSITLKNPNPFSVFVGANASGKSNIFEALEFLELCNIMIPYEAVKYFGNFDEILNQVNPIDNIRVFIDLGEIIPQLNISISTASSAYLGGYYKSKIAPISIPNDAETAKIYAFIENSNYLHFSNFTRLFVENNKLVKRQLQDDSRLNLDAGNLEKVLKRILKNEKKKEEIVEILQLLIPGIKDIDIKTEELSGSDNLLVYEDSLKKPLTKRLISDGTYNIIAIVTALYQSEEPQFLCIEEPENGLNPKVVRELVNIIRNICKEKGHYIWLNTHSQTLVSELTTEEIILVDKKNGLTQVKQIKGMDLHGLKMDEALLTNSLGGGIPW